MSITMKRGNTKVLTSTFERSGQPQDLTGCSIQFLLKKTPTDADSAALLNLSTGGGTVQISSPSTGGIATTNITPAMTNPLPLGAYIYIYRMTDSGGSVSTTEIGSFVISPG